MMWIAYANYPRPYWNEWEVLIEQGAGDIDFLTNGGTESGC